MFRCKRQFSEYAESPGETQHSFSSLSENNSIENYSEAIEEYSEEESCTGLCVTVPAALR